MKNPITTLHIQNFKTIKDLKVNCKRINIIIGKPNVGKSNFLEAISLLGAKFSENENKFISEFIRYRNFEDLFYDKETDKEIFVESNIATVCIKKNRGDHNRFDLALAKMDKGTLVPQEYFLKPHLTPEANAHWRRVDSLGTYRIHYSGNLESRSQWSTSIPVKKYEFRKGVISEDRFHEFLNPPNGNNIYTIVNANKNLKKEISSFFKEYKLEFVLRPSNTSFEVQKKINGTVYSNEYELIADTLQRMIFNVAAIESNKESILLFEEPEAHSFPPYVKMFAEKVIESKTNQFFITTHSPFILNTIVEKTPREEVAIFVASYDKFQTKFTELSQKQIEDMLNYGTDIFFSPQLLK
jgi:AAA15 family ATPase/GTPase